MAQAAPYIYYSLLAIGTGAQIRSTQNTAKAQAIQYKEQAKDEQSAARDREIERKRRLISSLSAQAAEAGATGVDPTVGTRKAIAIDSVAEGGYDSQTDSARTNRRSLLLKSAAKDVRSAADLQSAGLALNAGAQAVDFGTSRKKKK